MNYLNKKLINFWHNQSKKIEWVKFPSQVLKKSKNKFIWFPDGKLNVYDNCITKNLDLNKSAIITIDRKKNLNHYSYSDVDSLVDKFINFLKEKKKLTNSSKVMIHSSASIESAISMLACAKLGIEFSVIFEELYEEAILKRIKLFNPNIILTRLTCREFKQKYKKIYGNLTSRIIFFENFNASKKDKIKKKNKSEALNSNNNFFTLFTSGSTGEPKGIVHNIGGYFLYTKFTCEEQFGMNNKTVCLTASDAGWINGHTYALFGPLSFGGTTILLQSPTLILDEIILRKVIKLGLSILYLPVTIIRLLKSINQNLNIKSKNLLCLGSMGEPLASSIANWYSKAFNLSNNAVVNTYFQTETGGIIASPKHNETKFYNPHGSVGRPVNKFIKLNKLHRFKKTEIKIISPWPGCMKKVLNKSEYNKYFDKKGNFRLFDLGTKNKNNIYINGRKDDVINIRGHRIGSAEVESILLKIKKISEICAVAIKNEMEGSNLVLFVVSKINQNSIIEKEIINNFGTYALPAKIFYLDELPKTRSGKILRRLLRDMINEPNKKSYGDLSTLLNPRVVRNIKKIVTLNNENDN